MDSKGCAATVEGRSVPSFESVIGAQLLIFERRRCAFGVDKIVNGQPLSARCNR